MQLRLNGTSLASAIKLAEGKVPNEVQVLRVGKFSHPTYGFFEITKQTLAEMKSNFDSKVRGVDVCFDYFHKSDEDAAGWPENLELREDGNELWAVNVHWTPKASQKLSDREIRYFSPDFAFQWKDPETGVSHKNVLFGGGLTNRPFVKEMAAIVAHEKEQEMTELEKAQARVKELEGQTVKLSEQVAKLEGDVKAAQPALDETASLKAENEKLKAEIATLKTEQEKAMNEAKNANEAKVLAEKKGEFQKLLSEGKAVAAQEKSFLEGNMTEFIKLSQPVNLDGKGSSNSGDGNSGETKEDKILKLAEEKRKADPKLSHGESISLAKKEIKD